MVVRTGADLLGAAESWSEEEVEAGCQHLLDSIHSLLADEDTSLELRYPAQQSCGSGFIESGSESSISSESGSGSNTDSVLETRNCKKIKHMFLYIFFLISELQFTNVHATGESFSTS
jgi:hypothetical protein